MSLTSLILNSNSVHLYEQITRRKPPGSTVRENVLARSKRNIANTDISGARTKFSSTVSIFYFREGISDAHADFSSFFQYETVISSVHASTTTSYEESIFRTHLRHNAVRPYFTNDDFCRRSFSGNYIFY